MKKTFIVAVCFFMLLSIVPLPVVAQQNVSPTLYPNYSYLRSAWENAGRPLLYTHGGVRWNAQLSKYELDEHWNYGLQQATGQQAYLLEEALRGAINMGKVCHDIELLNEISQFLNVYMARFTTLGDLRKQQSPTVDTSLLNDQGDDSAKTLVWLDSSGGHMRIRECELCNSQFFHPIACLIRAIALLPKHERTEDMTQFVQTYLPIVVHDHLIRQMYVAKVDYWGAKDVPPHRIDAWQYLTTTTVRSKLSYQHAMLDSDLWLIAASAEILGAHAADPKLVQLNATEKNMLGYAIQTGVTLFRHKCFFYPDTRDFNGRVVGSISYFNGDFDDHPINAYAGYFGQTFPSIKDRKAPMGISWDISHSFRIPVFMRSLYDTKSATQLDFPSKQDIILLTNQYMYRVFQGDFTHPHLNNYLDGSNGWYNVGHGGPNTGFPPAQYCNCHTSKLHCTIVGAVQGWGLLATFNPDLVNLQQSLIRLASAEDPESVAFKDRYFWYDNKSFSFKDKQGNLQYPYLIYLLLSDFPEMLSDCPSQRPKAGDSNAH